MVLGCLLQCQKPQEHLLVIRTLNKNVRIRNKIGGSHHYLLICMAEFHDNLPGGTFGTVSKAGVKRPLSNFNFEFCGKVVSAHSARIGYLVRIIQEQEDRESDSEEVESTMPRFA